MSSHFVYTVSEFRAKMRGAFGLAEAGGKVFIDRYGETFELVHRPNIDPSVPFDEVTELSEKELKVLTGIKIPSNITVHSTPPDTPDLELVKDMETYEKKNSVGKPTIDLPQSKLREYKYCKAGHLLSPTGKCLQKGCKWN